MAQGENNPYKIPSARDIFLNTPLFEEFKFDPDLKNSLHAIEHFRGTLDFHCEECGQHSVFTAKEKPYSETHYYKNNIFPITFICSRNKEHISMFIFRAHNGVLRKIGQHPSLAELVAPDLKKYRKILGKERFQEFNRAIGLATHGVGIGAFVYLRRIFESLIESAHDISKADADWSEESYLRSRMEEKIDLLKAHLPPFLVQNRGLYGVLSVGVHTLSDSDCLSAFPAVRAAIEMILDDAIEAQQRSIKAKEAAESLAALKSTYGKPNTTN